MLVGNSIFDVNANSKFDTNKNICRFIEKKRPIRMTQMIRPFFMESWLEENRFSAKYNLGESGGRARTVSEIFTQSNQNPENVFKQFFDIKLNDSPNWGRFDLREIVAKFHPGASSENVLITTGTSEALFLLFHVLKPKKLALALPGFQLLYEIPQTFGAEIIPLPIYWDIEGKPFIDHTEWFDILKKQKPDCMLINNPHNPSGLIIEPDFLKSLKDLIKSWNGTVIGDEHYRFLASETELLGHTIYENDSHTFVTGSFIKCFGVPGLRIGWCVGNTKTLSLMQNEKNYTTHTVSPITEWISYEILKNTNTPLFSTMQAEWIQNKKILGDFLNSSKNIYGTAPHGGLVTSLGFRDVNSIEQTLSHISDLNQMGVFVLPLSAMEVGNFSFPKFRHDQKKYLSNINYGFGFRCGLGIAPSEFKTVLSTRLK